MRTTALAAVLLVTCAAAPSIAVAQRFPFERTLPVGEPTRLDVSTIRGKIEVVAGAPGRIVVKGDATVRVGFNVPVNAVELARQVAASPPIEQTGNTVRLQEPADQATQRAVTIAYRIQVPPDTAVQTASNSGETTIHGIGGSVDVRTQSGAITVRGVSGTARVSTGSGAVTAEDVSGALTVNTASSAFRGTGLGASLHVRTQSGHVDAALTGMGDVDVETGSSAIELHGLRGGLTAKTQSGKVTVEGVPERDWTTTTGSSSVNLDVDANPGFSLDAVSRSGAVIVDGGNVQGSIAQRAVKGTVGRGGPAVRIDTGSGSIRVRVR